LREFCFFGLAKLPPAKIKMASKGQQPENAQWFSSTSERWVTPYYDKNDLKFVDRESFA